MIFILFISFNHTETLNTSNTTTPITTPISSINISSCVTNFTIDCLTTTLDSLYDYLSTLGVIDYAYSIIKALIVIGSGLVLNPHIIGFLTALLVFYYIFKLAYPVIRVAIKMIAFPFRSCVQVVRYKYPKRYNPHEGRLGCYTQSGGRSTGQGSAAPAVEVKTDAEVIRNVEEPEPSVVEATMTEDIAPAMNPQDMVSCKMNTNTIFSGPLAPVKTWFHRKFPPYEKTRYHLTGPEYEVQAQVDTFTWKTTDTTDTLIYNKSLASILVTHPRYKFLRSLWTQFRYGVRIIIAPTVNSMASGSLIGYLNTRGTTSTFPRINFGFSPHGFIQPSSNQHLSFEIPEIGVDHWYNIQGDTSSSIGQFCPWNLHFSVLSPLQIATGGPTQMTYTVYCQLINIRARWPQAISASTQGLFGGNTTININKMENSALPMNMTGDTNTLSIPAFGMDYPSDTRQIPPMIMRTFQKLNHSKGTISATKVANNPNSLVESLWTGENETSLAFLYSRPRMVGDFKLNSTDAQGSLITSLYLTPGLGTGSDVNEDPLGYMTNFSLSCEYDHVHVRFYIPKNPYFNGKVLATLTQCVTPPSTITGGGFNMSTAPSFIIDLSTPDLVHEWTIPWLTINEYMLAPPFNGIVSNFIYPQLALYTLNSVTPSANSPSSVKAYISYSFDNFRFLEPQCLSIYTQGGERVALNQKVEKKDMNSETVQMACRTSAAKFNMEPDTVFTASNDEIIDLRQYWRIPHMLLSGKLTTNSLSTAIRISYDAIFALFPMLKFYRFMSGSLRYVLTFTNWGDCEFMVIECDKMSTQITTPNLETTLCSRFYNIQSDAVNGNFSVVNNYTDASQLDNLYPSALAISSSGAQSNQILVYKNNPQVVIDFPIASPHGFAIQDGTLKYGNIMQISPVPYPPATTTMPTCSISVAVGDDFTAHGLSNSVVRVERDNIATFRRFPAWF